MGNFNKGGRGGNKFGGRNSGGNRGASRGFGRRDSDRAQKHQATCSDCGNSCEVPFRPTGSKPVFCDNCFKNKGGGRNSGDRDSRPRFDNRHDAGRPGKDYRQDFEQLNSKLDKILEALASTTTKTKTTVKKPAAKKPATKKTTKKSVAKKTATKKATPKKKK